MGKFNSGINIAKQCAAWIKANGKTSVLQTKPTISSKINTRLFWADKKAEIKPDVAYHGSPFKFDSFDSNKIGTGEGINKYSKGLYLFRTKKIAPFYANIRSKDAPIHIGNTAKLENPKPTIYTVGGLKDLKLKTVTPKEAKAIGKNQATFEKEFSNIDGLELDDGQIIVFPKSIDKLRIDKRQELLEFVKENKSYPFRSWTTDIEKLKLSQSV